MPNGPVFMPALVALRLPVPSGEVDRRIAGQRGG
jgi:hypothetical protein